MNKERQIAEECESGYAASGFTTKIVAVELNTRRVAFPAKVMGVEVKVGRAYDILDGQIVLMCPGSVVAIVSDIGRLTPGVRIYYYPMD